MRRRGSGATTCPRSSYGRHSEGPLGPVCLSSPACPAASSTRPRYTDLAGTIHSATLSKPVQEIRETLAQRGPEGSRSHGAGGRVAGPRALAGEPLGGAETAEARPSPGLSR